MLSHSSISSDRVRFRGDICADFQHCSLSNTETGDKEEKEEDAFKIRMRDVLDRGYLILYQQNRPDSASDMIVRQACP